MEQRLAVDDRWMAERQLGKKNGRREKGKKTKGKGGCAYSNAGRIYSLFRVCSGR